MSTEAALSVTQPVESSVPVTGKLPRLWPAVVLVVLYWIGWGVVTAFELIPFAEFMTMFWSPILTGLGIIIWWLAFSRLPWRDRWWGLGSLAAGALWAILLCHSSMYMGLLMYGLPLVVTVMIGWLVVTGGALSRGGRLGLLSASLLVWGYFTLLRVDGIDGHLTATKSWRWTQTAEDVFLAQRKTVTPTPVAATAAEEIVTTADDWTDFRGPLRDGIVHGTNIAKDWTKQPPRQVWKRLVGPGWSSFAVVGDRAFTQEQRGENEAVFCFDVATGNEIWSHEDKARFYDVVSGAGPRGTPTVRDGHVYALGGSGKLNCFKAATGERVWSRDIMADAAVTEAPPWGFSSSPLLVQGIAIVFAGGKDGKSIVGYDSATGEIKWTAGKGLYSYSSPQLATIAGQDAVLSVTNAGVEAFEPATGKALWTHEWLTEDFFRVCQPLVIGDSQVLIGTGMGLGTRLVSVSREGDEWKTDEVWTSRDLKPYFNDFVKHGDHLYGFDGSIMVCIDLATGKKEWKKGRYGHGQVLLAGDQGLLIIISETGEAILAEASPKDLIERGKIQAVNGKTWNHPVITAQKLLVRNGEEMACYDLSP